MSRKNKKNRQEELPTKTSKQTRLARETVQTVWALIFLAGAIILALAGFHTAGRAGETLFGGLYALFGWGYVLLPLTLAGISIELFLQRNERSIYGPTLWGALLFIIAALGFIDVCSDGQAGLIGTGAGYIKTFLGAIAWGIMLIVAAIIGIVISLDRPIVLGRKQKEQEYKNIYGPIETPKTHLYEKESAKQKGLDADEEKERAITKEASNLPIRAFKLDDRQKTESGVIKKFADYKAPPIELLKSSIEKPNGGDLKANMNIIHRTLESFGIPVEMGEINIGPKVTRYALRPAEGIKLSRITALHQDLSLALSAHPIRIEAPIPGKPYVGIEVPNKNAAVVRLGSLISYPEFAQAGNLGFAIGRDVTGEPVFANIEKMPHMLIAGATGSGKSIMLHSVLISLLYKNSPQTLRLVLIDPKRVELSAYNNLPHLIAPVVTQGKKALSVFKWAIAEMEKRYETLLKAGVRDIQSFNKKNNQDAMAYIVIVVDEMADLMAAYGRDVENAIVRLAQMARATGIHLILSTQRPSVEVITGLIKANITARIALQVASQIDSRTILDSAGAEKLLGGGDLLFVSAELSKPKRIQGSYLSEEEIKKVTDFIKENNADWTNESDDENISFAQITQEGSEQTRGENNAKDVFEEYSENEEDDDLYADAVELVKQYQKASATFLQRKLGVGYSRAARLLDLMEEHNIIGPGNGAKAREVFILPENPSGAVPKDEEDESDQ